jgi:hypothetical protein
VIPVLRDDRALRRMPPAYAPRASPRRSRVPAAHDPSPACGAVSCRDRRLRRSPSLSSFRSNSVTGREHFPLRVSPDGEYCAHKLTANIALSM